MSDSRQFIERKIREHREWLEKNGDRIHARELKYLRQDLEDGSFAALQTVGDSLGCLANLFGIRGTLQIIDDDETGWTEIARSALYHAWIVRIRSDSCFKSMQPVSNLTNYTSRIASLLCFSVVYGWNEWRDFCQDVLVKIGVSHGAVDKAYWDRRVFEPFVLECSRLQDGEISEFNQTFVHRSDPYSDVVRGWNNLDALEAAVANLCDYHCANMADETDSWDAEFSQSPFDLLACEIFFIYKVRSKLGLPNPHVNHPLLTAPLTARRDALALEYDDILDRVRAIHSEYFAGR